MYSYRGIADEYYAIYVSMFLMLTLAFVRFKESDYFILSTGYKRKLLDNMHYTIKYDFVSQTTLSI